MSTLLDACTLILRSCRFLSKRDCLQSSYKTVGNLRGSLEMVINLKESLVVFRPVIFFSLVFLNLVNYIYTACLELPLPLAVKDLKS